MPMDAKEIERLIKARFPDAEVTIGTSPATATTTRPTSSPANSGKTRVQQHKMVYEALEGRMGGRSARAGAHDRAPKD